MGTNKVLTIILNNERSISWNDLYSGKHWTYRKAITDKIHQLVQLALQLQGKDLPHFTKPVLITITSYMTHPAYDPDNVCTKLYIDGLKKNHRAKIGGKFKTTEQPYWVIEEDNPNFVDGVLSRVRPVKTNARVEIEIKEAV